MSLLNNLKKIGWKGFIAISAILIILVLWNIFFWQDLAAKEKFCHPHSYEQTAVIKSKVYVVCIDSNNTPILRKYHNE